MSGNNSVNNKKEYTADSFESHEGLDGVRVRPTMYIGSIGKEGIYRLFLEAYGNCIDEYNVGRADTCKIFYDSKQCKFIVEDNALGIPVEKFHEALTKLHTGAKFGKSTYDYSLGLNGVGIKAINALSSSFTVDTYYKGKHGHFYSEKSIEKDFWIKDDANHPSGTKVEWIPDIEVMEELGADYHKYSETLNMNAYINAGIRTILNWDGKITEYYHPDGLLGYFSDITIKRSKLKAICPPITNFNKQSIQHPKKPEKMINMDYTVYFTWCENLKSESVESYVNGLKTINGGSHVTGVHIAMTKALKNYIDKNNIIPKNAKFDIDGNDVRETLAVVINIHHSDPKYTTQIKDAMDNKDIQFFISTSLYQFLQNWLANHKKEADAICKLILRSAKAREAAKNAKENIIKTNSKLGLSNINLAKYSGCKCKNPEETELFIVEGDSAGGSAKEARNTYNQAIFKIKGKIQNIMGSKNPTFTDELTTMVEVLGCAIGSTFDIRKLRFHKIVFAADADADGYDIKLLLGGFFFKYYRPLIEAGYVYEAMPPLFQLDFGSGSNKKTVYLQDQKSFNKAISYISEQAFDIETINGVKLSNNIMRNYIASLLDFKLFMEQLSTQSNLNPELLEFVCRYYTDLCNKKFDKMNALDYDCTVIHESPDHIHINIDREYEHYFLALDHTFYKTIYKPIANRLSKIMLMNVVFVGKKTGQKYGGSSYRNACFIENLLLGKGVTVTRVKGLGESNAADLRNYMFNPLTRNIRQLTISDTEKASKVFDMCLGKNIDDRKLFCMGKPVGWM